MTFCEGQELPEDMRDTLLLKNVRESNEVLDNRDPNLFNCRHNKTSAWVRSVYCVW